MIGTESLHDPAAAIDAMDAPASTTQPRSVARDVVTQWRRALKAAALAERRHRDPAPMRRLYDGDPESNED